MSMPSSRAYVSLEADADLTMKLGTDLDYNGRQLLAKNQRTNFLSKVG